MNGNGRDVPCSLLRQRDPVAVGRAPGGRHSHGPVYGLARESELVNFVYNTPEDDLDTTRKAKAESHAAAEFYRWQWEYLGVHENMFRDVDMPIAGFTRE